MKWISTFLIGALIGAIGILVTLSSISPDSARVAAPIVVTPAATPPAVMAPAASGIAIAPVAMPAPDAIGVLPAAGSDAATAAAAVANPLLIPVAGISASQLKDTFDEARGSERRHEALDILAPKGTQVFAVADGKVAKLFDSKPGGLTAYQFDTSEKFAYYYAHLDRYAAGVNESTFLKQGDLVGYVGTSGNADPATPHLHFAIFELGPEKQWWKGSPINPYPLLGGAKRP